MKAWKVMLKCKTWYMFPLSKFTTGWVSKLVLCDISDYHEWADLEVWLLRLWLGTRKCLHVNIEKKNSNFFFFFLVCVSFLLLISFYISLSKSMSLKGAPFHLFKKSPRLLQENQGFKTKVINIALGSNPPSALFGNLDNCLSWFLSSLSTGH